MNEKTFPLAVIGGGPAGYAAAMRAVDFGQEVLLIERNRLGGAGLHDGALSSKTLWEISREFSLLRSRAAARGTALPTLSMAEVKGEMLNAVQQREDQLRAQLDHLREGADARLQYVQGEASLVNAHTLAIKGSEGRTVQAAHTILATGSRPRKLDHISIDEEIIFSSDGISRLDHFPESLVILGAGVIGCEFATIFANFGCTRVFLIDKAERILPFEDADLSQLVEQNLAARGVTVHRGARLLRMEVVDEQVEYELEFDGGRRELHRVEKALISVGRVPNVENLGLGHTRIQLDGRGHIAANASRTAEPTVFAVGDLTADLALVNVGELEGRHAVEQIFGKPRPLCYDNISTIMFLCPEVAAVGMNEQQARNLAIPHHVARVHYAHIARAIAMRQTDGFFKILIRQDDHRILGMRAVGEHASSAIQAVSLLIAMNKTAEELSELIHPHPSLTEGVQECARLFNGKSIFKPRAETGLSLHSWAPGAV